MACSETVLVHGGAGRWKPRRARAALPFLKKAVEEALRELAEVRDHVEAAVRAVEVLEDSGVFNAGRGSARDAAGGISMDAAVMDGETGDAGAVANVRKAANPVRLALEVMRRTPHVLLVGPEADKLAVEWGLKTLKRRAGKPGKPRFRGRITARGWENLDTVGAVVLDSQCRLAAAVSTGGVGGKMPGRVGDSPIVGAGIYASRHAAAVATGIGEVIMLSVLSFRVVQGASLPGGVAQSAATVVKWVTGVYGENTVGVIGIDVRGGVAAIYNTEHMPWAFGRRGGDIKVGGIPSSLV